MITEPGTYPDIPLEVYHHDPKLCDGPSISHSGLDLIFDHSPAHYFYQSPLNPEPHDEPEPSEAMTLGRSAHHLFLGEPGWAKAYVQRPAKAPDGRDWNGNNLSCKAWVEKQRDAGLTVLKPDQVRSTIAMAKALEAEPLIRQGILRGKIEQSMLWKDEDTGVWLRARPDVIPNDAGDFADLKCLSDVSYDALERTIGEFGYHRQGALVREAAKHLLGISPESFTFTLVCVESKPPHCVTIVTLSDEDLDLGHLENRKAIRLFAHCLETGQWPGPAGEQNDARIITVKQYIRDRNVYRRRQIEAGLAIAPEQSGDQPTKWTIQ